VASESTRKKAQSRRHFDRWSRSYESDPSSRRLAALQQAALDALALESGDRLLDVGCGSGAAVRHAAPTVERAIGVDLSPGMIERARGLAKAIPEAEFLECDSEALPFEAGTFTAVLCTTAFHHFPAPSRAVNEMARVLAPGGRVVLGDGCTDRLAARALNRILLIVQPSHVGFYRSHELEGMLTAAGLSHETTGLLWSGGYAIVRARK